MKRRLLILLLSAAAALAALVLLAFYMRKATDEFDSRHPHLSNPLESDASGIIRQNTDSASSESPYPSASSSSSGEKSGLSTAQEAGISLQKESDKSVLPEVSEAETETEMPEQERSLPVHKIIFVGDSRTIGMQNALKKYLPDDDCVFVGKVGEGCSWFLSEGKSLMADAISQNPDAPVVLNFGVNDPDQIDEYLAAYRDMVAEYPDTTFWFLSVNPVQRARMIEYGASEDALDLVTNTNITKLNLAVQQAFPGHYLDSSTILKLEGFRTVDGLHFTGQTYLRIHRFVVDELFGS
ncbi:SGNH/GDSL hydrolase family protein [Porcincola intestinalis]|uniref:Uncharacterized protein n=1 Tax=Porcincola intestinalis TaxID=2606632 RepID=A0A6L5X8G7_9FIRM|nr:hypothetical protein [Porcincola intestinalis]MSS15897.1 hypothetical protein [Porcincola intestinalis]